MPKEFLSKFQKTKNQLKKLVQSKFTLNSKLIESAEENQNVDDVGELDNLFDPTFSMHSDVGYAFKELDRSVFLSYKNLILAICVVFSFLLLLNSYLDFRLRYLKNTQNNLSSSIEKFNEDRGKINEISEKIAYYKNSVIQRSEMYEPHNFILSSAKDMTLVGYELDREKFTITLKGSNPISFTKLISTYLANEFVSQIVIVGANYDSRNDLYTVTLKGDLQ